MLSERATVGLSSDTRAHRELDWHMPAIANHRDIAVPTGAEFGIDMVGRGHRDNDRHPQRAAIAAIRVRNTDLHKRVAGDSGATARPPQRGAKRDRRFERRDIAKQRTRVRHDGELTHQREIAHIDARTSVKSRTFKRVLANAEARLGRDAVYAQVAVNHPEGQSRRHAQPRVRAKAQRASERTGSQTRSRHDLNRDLFRPEHQRWRFGARAGNRNATQQQWPTHVRTLALLALAACHYDVGEADSAFYSWDRRAVHCAVDIDTYARISTTSIETGLDRARDRGEVLELYTHEPGATVTWDAIEAVLAGAQARGLAFVTYADMVFDRRPSGGGIALSFDDRAVPAWLAGRELFKRYNARLTFFVSGWTPSLRDGLRALASDGHDIEAHSVNHLRGPVMVEERGLAAYISDEVVPSIDVLRQDGYDVQAFAYPFGARTAETDRAILRHVPLVRSVAYTWDSPAIDPCPY